MGLGLLAASLRVVGVATTHHRLAPAGRRWLTALPLAQPPARRATPSPLWTLPQQLRRSLATAMDSPTAAEPAAPKRPAEVEVDENPKRPRPESEQATESTPAAPAAAPAGLPASNAVTTGRLVVEGISRYISAKEVTKVFHIAGFPSARARKSPDWDHAYVTFPVCSRPPDCGPRKVEPNPGSCATTCSYLGRLQSVEERDKALAMVPQLKFRNKTAKASAVDIPDRVGVQVWSTSR